MTPLGSRPAALPRRRHARVVGAAASLLLLALLLAPAVGSTSLDLTRVWADPWSWNTNPDAAVFFVARLPRVLLAALVGAILAQAGAVFQSLLRNPLATPYTIGVSAGATLGAFVGMRLAPPGLGGELLVPASALAGAFVTTLAVFGLAVRGGRVPTTVLLLAGVTLNYTFGAVIMLMQYFADHTETARMVRWMMGDLEGGTYRLLALVLAGAAPALWALSRRGLVFNLLSLGEEEAEIHGVDSRRAILGSLLAAAWITGLAVSVAGPVGFVGIIVPHALRLLGGADYRILLPAAVLGGAGFMILCDTLSRTLLAPLELPVGVLTASLGGPFFLYLLLARRAR
ncbi:MAG: FecCD family ABC transporter permease [Acidobacteriota bacterium]